MPPAAGRSVRSGEATPLLELSDRFRWTAEPRLREGVAVLASARETRIRVVLASSRGFPELRRLGQMRSFRRVGIWWRCLHAGRDTHVSHSWWIPVFQLARA